MEGRIKEINSGGNFFEGAGKEARKEREWKREGRVKKKNRGNREGGMKKRNRGKEGRRS